MPSADFYRNLLYYLLAEIKHYLRVEHDPETLDEKRREARDDIRKAVEYVKDKLW